MKKSSREAEKKCTEVLLSYSPTFTVTALNCTYSLKLFAVPAHWSEIDQRSELHTIQHGTLRSRFFHRNVSKTGPGVDQGSGAFTQTAWEQEQPILGSSRQAHKHGRNLLSHWERERERKKRFWLYVTLAINSRFMFPLRCYATGPSHVDTSGWRW